jgi:hypothetical protein
MQRQQPSRSTMLLLWAVSVPFVLVNLAIIGGAFYLNWSLGWPYGLFFILVMVLGLVPAILKYRKIRAARIAKQG